jgi:hypothetical protein
MHMQDGFYRRQRAIKFSGMAMCALALSLCVHPTKLSAQGAAPKGSRCFAINVHLNGQAIAGPKTVTLKTTKAEDTVSLDQTCFQLPSDMLKSELIEISFTLPGSQIHMADIPTDFFSGQWDVQLADKKFGSDVSVPKHANVSGICAVVFHGGDSEQSLSQPQCRTPLTVKAGN